MENRVGLRDSSLRLMFRGRWPERFFPRASFPPAPAWPGPTPRHAAGSAGSAPGFSAN